MFKMTSDGKITRWKVVHAYVIYNLFVVDIFFSYEIIYYPKIQFEVLYF